jgi:hypothetical protein
MGERLGERDRLGEGDLSRMVLSLLGERLGERLGEGDLSRMELSRPGERLGERLGEDDLSRMVLSLFSPGGDTFFFGLFSDVLI